MMVLKKNNYLSLFDSFQTTTSAEQLKEKNWGVDWLIYFCMSHTLCLDDWSSSGRGLDLC